MQAQPVLQVPGPPVQEPQESQGPGPLEPALQAPQELRGPDQRVRALQERPGLPAPQVSDPPERPGQRVLQGPKQSVQRA